MNKQEVPPSEHSVPFQKQKLGDSNSHHHLEKLDASIYFTLQSENVLPSEFRWSLLYNNWLCQFLNAQLFHQLVNTDLKQRIRLLQDKSGNKTIYKMHNNKQKPDTHELF